MSVFKRTETKAERMQSALYELISGARWSKSIPELSRSGQFLHSVLEFAVLAGISEACIAKKVGSTTNVVKMWLRSSSATPRKPEVVMHILTKLDEEIRERKQKEWEKKRGMA